MNAPERAASPARLPGVIDTLSAGYRTLNRHLYLLLVPITLDVLYWLGPRLSVEPLARQMIESIERMRTSAALSVTAPRAVQSWDILIGTVDSIGKNANLLSLLSGPLSIPSLLASQDLSAPAWWQGFGAVSIASPTQLLGVSGMLFILGVLLGAVYMGLIAQVVRTGSADTGVLVRRCVLYAIRFIALLLLALLCGIFIGFPIALLIGLMTLINPLVGSLLVLLFWVAVLWLYFYLFFTVDALFVSEVGPLKAVQHSVTVVRLSTSSALGLFLAILIISLGIPYVWSALGSSDLATLAGILGSAYIGTGLTTASMIYYRDRIGSVVSSQ